MNKISILLLFILPCHVFAQENENLQVPKELGRVITDYINRQQFYFFGGGGSIILIEKNDTLLITGQMSTASDIKSIANFIFEYNKILILHFIADDSTHLSSPNQVIEYIKKQESFNYIGFYYAKKQRPLYDLPYYDYKIYGYHKKGEKLISIPLNDDAVNRFMGYYYSRWQN